MNAKLRLAFWADSEVVFFLMTGEQCLVILFFYLVIAL